MYNTVNEIETILHEMQARADAATEGWVRDDRAIVTYRHGLGGENPLNILGQDSDGCFIVWEEADAEFIAHARTDLPTLIKALRYVMENHHEGEGEFERGISDILQNKEAK